MRLGASQRSHWMRCFLVALAMHGGVVATALWLRVDEAPVEASMDAFLVELASEPRAAPSPPRELAPGPVQAQSEPRTAPDTPVPDRVPETPRETLPAVPVLHDDPEVVEPTSSPAGSAPATPPSREAAHASAPPSVNAQASDALAAPRTVAGTSHESVENWHGLLLGHLGRHRRYPRQAERRGEQGVSYVRFDVDHHGRVANPVIARGSGIAALDAEALATVRRASPVPPPPDTLPDEVENVVVPVEFFISQ